MTDSQNSVFFSNPRQIISPESATPSLAHMEEPHSKCLHSDSEENSTSQQTPVPVFAQPQELESSAESPHFLTTTKAKCLECGNKSPENWWFCGVCELKFCDSCWGEQAAHKMRSRPLTSTPHEKTPLDIAYKIGKVLSPTEDDRQREKLHRKDENTAWFGMSLRPLSINAADATVDVLYCTKVLKKTNEGADRN